MQLLANRSADDYTIVISFAKTSPYAYYGKEQFSLSMDSSIDTLTNYQYTTAKLLMGLLLLGFVSKACWTSTSAWLSIECHWLAYTGNHLAGYHHTTIM